MSRDLDYEATQRERAAKRRAAKAQANADGWTPVATRPRKPGRYIVHTSNGDIITAWHDGAGALCWLAINVALDVTHWRPLPAPPTAGSEGK